MFDNEFTRYLKEKGWFEVSPMYFRHEKYPDYDFYFDTSSQIEIYKDKRRVGTAYLEVVSDLIDELNKLELVE